MSAITNLNGYEIKDKLARDILFNLYFDNVSEMLNSDTLKVGDIVKTLGYHESNDGGDSFYIIRVKLESDVEDKGKIHFLKNSLVAELLHDGTVNVKQYGAIGNGVTDDTLAIQNAIDDESVEEVIIPKGTFIISLDDINYGFRGTGIGLKLKSNMILKGTGTLKLKEGSKGVSSSIISNTVETIENVKIEDITIDGNRDNVTGKTNNICLFGGTNCLVKNVKSFNSSFCGIMSRDLCHNIVIENNYVDGCNEIGIQVSYCTNAIINKNRVKNCIDNGIDVYWDDENNAHTDTKTYTNITNNFIDTTKYGIFLESTSYFTVIGNTILNSNWAGIILNRIHTGANRNIISSNILRQENNGGTGIKVSNCGMTIITNNMINNFSCAFTFSHSANGLMINGNFFENIKYYFFDLVKSETESLSLVKSRIEKNYCYGVMSTTMLTFPNSTYNRKYNVTLENPINLDTNNSFTDGVFYSMLDNTRTVSSWGNNYAIYYNGNTTVKTVTPLGLDSSYYVKINNTFFKVVSMNDKELIITDINGVSGDYTSIVNGNYPIEIYSATDYARLNG